MCCFQTATIIHDATQRFGETCLGPPHARLAEQMVLAARAVRQNIAAATRVGATSARGELALWTTARANLDGLLMDYEDFLRHRHLPQWPGDSHNAAIPRIDDPPNNTSWSDDQRYARYAPWLDHDDPAVRANVLIVLIRQTAVMLDLGIAALEARLADGGYAERLSQARLSHRVVSQDVLQENYPVPDCPLCGSSMALRTVKSGIDTGRTFWGCNNFPACKGTASV